MIIRRCSFWMLDLVVPKVTTRLNMINVVSWSLSLVLFHYGIWSLCNQNTQELPILRPPVALSVTQLHSALSGSQQNHMPAGKEYGWSQLRAKQGHFSTDRVHGAKHALRNWWFLCGLPLEVECSWPSPQVFVFSASHIQFTSFHSATLRPCTCVSPWCGGALPVLLSLSFCTSNRSRFHIM